ncbi:MAG: glycosyl transferase [Clostridiales bacterium]|nr:glycosyl transferase [Clostridiales bacterium]
MFDYKRIFKNRELRLRLINCLRFIPSGPYLKMVFYIKTGKHLNLKSPVTFCDKQNWLKLNDIHPEYTELVDKTKVAAYIYQKTGKYMTFPILGIWNSYDEIDFDSLPERFVLKCNHDSGSVKVIHDKNKIDHKIMKAFYDSRMRINTYVLGREYPYKNVKPLIFAEKYMTPVGCDDIEDYKFFCFNGKPTIMFVATDRSSDCKFDFYDMDFNHLDIENIHPQSGRIIEKPACFEEMKRIASLLSQGMRFVRIDLYEIEGKIYFGEFTFFHGGGFWPLSPDKWEYDLGALLDIEN